ncbi:MAG: hypothetical protein LBL58_11270 [Tannerellaceae bacterium]|jgi:hypothetical protein|nr:hypothetical protein [Tannerellaceae bacterium]
MKKTVLLLFAACVSLVTYAQQKDLKEIGELTFFGIDFSLAKVYGATETPHEFLVAFEGINDLLRKEEKKYNPAKLFGKENIVTVLSMAYDLINEINENDIKVDRNDYILTWGDIEQQVRSYNTGDETGYGAILIAGLLDKGKKQATYDIVVFNIETREIIVDKKIIAKAGGLGLRNYWAASVYKAMKKTIK